MMPIVLLALLCCGGLLASGQEIKSTDFYCANAMVRLQCDRGEAVFVSRVVHKYSATQCLQFDANMNQVNKPRLPAPTLDHCLGIDFHDDRILRECNGKESCDVLIQKKSHMIGFYGTNCDFQSNIAKIFYTCVPTTLRSSIKSFDICEKNGPEFIAGLSSGFVHSPNFPNYYGNNRLCVVNIAVPAGQRLVLYLINLSMEGLSILDGKANDFLLVDTDKELYGKLDMPYILYNASDRESVQLKFKTDWITTTRLNSPKGFLIYFALTDAFVTTTTVATTTTEPMAVTESLLVDKNMTSSEEAFDMEAAHIKHSEQLEFLRERRGDNVVTIISVLVGVIGLLILIIFGLLLLFRSKRQDKADDDQIYDTVSDEKSMSNIYGSDYNGSQSYSSATASDSMNDEDKQKLKGSTGAVKESKFNQRLRKFYSSVGQTLSLSSKILAEANEPREAQLNNSSAKLTKEDAGAKELDESSSSKVNLKMFSINEFNPNDVDIKYEKDIAIDTLKLCKTPSSSSNFKRAIGMYKSSNLDQTDALNRSENIYVTSPVEESSTGEQSKLQIYEVNFDNNYAYIHPPVSSVVASEAVKSNVDNAEIYQTINELDDNDDDGFGDEIQEASKTPSSKQSVDDLSAIYQTPCNKRILSSTTLPDSDQLQTSVIQLLNENNETLA